MPDLRDFEAIRTDLLTAAAKVHATRRDGNAKDIADALAAREALLDEWSERRRCVVVVPSR